ncbi:signal peptidase protein-like protein [Baffinella frigidus]|nr:signal peptidase protein-like protein [Cryptophyta sp. CCMP2293]|mmetsp:Transcript_2887/g.6826  ORF Transcript_2887/g.6826 Transcript_2887/m.6826 type:complete len:190 (-) Transcript_2887:197-766(-)|eukprot:CAMPEP_0180147496 /NCGR_PEP_ID=MMETSP0986-20121125/19309_1 /TAXON_ID=697907 /ORGANISM="non described non described, Strain CCMP2293" /LENGTH=189 /DNA_ID=CAMNT_0022093093 /DNA_START=156 /DNA_END=725 /DNA_ORIENTATION=-
MHSWTFRLNAIFTFTVTVLAVLSALNALSVSILDPQPVATIDNVKLNRLPGSGPKRPNAEARVMFDMAADFRTLFTWNTKLIFLFVTAEYKTELNQVNQVVIWDYIIEDVKHAELTVGRAQTMLLPRHHNEYPLIDQGRGIRGSEGPVKLVLNWCTMPIVGIISRQRRAVSEFTFPETWEKLAAVSSNN